MSKLPNNEAISPARHDECIDQNPEAFYNAIEDKIHSSLRVMIPAMVLAYQRKTHELWVQPLIAMTDTAGRAITSGALPCTAIRHYSGKYLIDIPIHRGDTGWLIAADRDTSRVKENYDDNNTKLSPRESDAGQTHRFEFGFFIPDKWFKTSNIDAKNDKIELTDEDIEGERMVIQNCDASQRISIGQSDIKVYCTDATVNVEKTATVTVGEKSTVTCPTCNVISDNITISKKSADMTRVSIEGKLFVSETIYAGHDVISCADKDEDTTAQSLSLNAHVHGQGIGGSYKNNYMTTSPYCYKYEVETEYVKRDVASVSMKDNKYIGSPIDSVEKNGFLK